MEQEFQIELFPYILSLEQEGWVTRTFRRLDPARQQAVVQAILDEAAERGPADLSIKGVARRAGVAVGSLYTYFPDRDGMLSFAVELCVRYFQDAFAAFRPMLAALPLGEALAAYLTGGIEWSRAQAGLLRLFVRAAYTGDPQLQERLVRPLADEMRLTVEAILAEAASRGEIRPEVDLPAAARLIHSLTITAGDSQLLPYLNVYFQVIGDEVSPPRSLAALLDLISAGIQP